MSSEGLPTPSATRSSASAWSNASSIPPPHSSSRRTIRSSIKRSRRLPASEICSRSSRGSCLPRRQDKKGLRGSVWVQTKNGAKKGVNEGEERGGEEQRSEEHTSELQSLMRISYAVFCLKQKKKNE